jgi:hypothetical protein
MRSHMKSLRSLRIFINDKSLVIQCVECGHECYLDVPLPMLQSLRSHETCEEEMDKNVKRRTQT